MAIGFRWQAESKETSLKKIKGFQWIAYITSSLCTVLKGLKTSKHQWKGFSSNAERPKHSIVMLKDLCVTYLDFQIILYTVNATSNASKQTSNSFLQTWESYANLLFVSCNATFHALKRWTGYCEVKHNLYAFHIYKLFSLLQSCSR